MRKIDVFLIAAIAMFVISCGNTENSSEVTEVATKTDKEVKEPLKFKILEYDKAVTEQITFVGKPSYFKMWQDANGVNVIMFSQKSKVETHPESGDDITTHELHIYHYKKVGAKYELVREVKDFQMECMFENRLRLMDNSISITDLNNDNYAEICFVYRLGCTSELSPDILKLIMLENGEKYAIRGNTLVDYGFEKVGGETNIDKSFNNISKEILKFAKDVWNRNQVHNYSK